MARPRKIRQETNVNSIARERIANEAEALTGAYAQHKVRECVKKAEFDELEYNALKNKCELQATIIELQKKVIANLEARA